MNKFPFIAFLLFAFLSCSTSVQRLPTTSSQTETLSYYLSVDKFKYYVSEYAIAMENRIPKELTKALKDMSIEEVLEMNIKSNILADTQNYDTIIFNYLKNRGLLKNIKATELKWEYNFLKNKMNEAYRLAPSKLDILLSLDSKEKSLVPETKIVPEVLDANEMTLDSGHYISNRTTRAIFWEAIESDRTIEFHLGDSREFLKQLKELGGEILFEVKPSAKNYNKIFVIQYPKDTTFRYAITNIGGKDRLDHLTKQLSLSNFKGLKLKNKILVKGNLEKFHAIKTQEHIQQLKLLPKADRVIIGQKESLDSKFTLFWKVRALKNLYDANPTLFNKKLSADVRQQLTDLEKSPLEVIFKEKKVIEDAFLVFEAEFEKKPSLYPVKFKLYNFDNFTIEMADYIFTSNSGKSIRWRVVSNVWGDEIIPIAQAFKATGHLNIVYMGTAGAFANKDYKVGDLVIPGSVQEGAKKIEVKADTLKITGAKYGGNVEHVSSPFEESLEWLETAKSRSEIVEVETLYLRQIFNGSKDNIEMYLLISDILGSESETLAHATSSKRKNNQNKLLASLFERDSVGLPKPIENIAQSTAEKNRDLVFNTLSKKTIAYRYYVYSHLKNTANLSVKDITAFAESNAAFTDAFIIERLVKVGELIHEMNKKYAGNAPFEIAFSKSLVMGTWNPKSEKLQIILKPKNTKDEKVLKQELVEFDDHLSKIKSFADVSASMAIESNEMIWMKVPERTDPDFLIKVYSFSGLQNAGIYHNITYNGNLTLELLPTDKFEEPISAFYQGVSSAKNLGKVCMDAMKALLSKF